MSGIIARFKTTEPVKFTEKGCDTEFAAHVQGAVYIDIYDEAAYGENENERRNNLSQLMVRLVTARLSKWSERDERIYKNGNGILELLLMEDIAAEGITGSVRVDYVDITDELKDMYQKQIIDPAREAEEEAFRKKLEEADEPHGPLIMLSYDLFTHGMAAGTSSSSNRGIEWKADGSVIYTSSTSSSGRNFRSEYKVKPEVAKKVRDYIDSSKLPALAKMNLKTPEMFDNFTSATINMTFDDSSIGKDPRCNCHLNCGASRMTYKSIEDEISKLLKECEETGECIKNEMYETPSGIGGFFMGMDIPGSSDMNGNGNHPSNIASNTPSQSTQGKWVCKCGAENTGKFCMECGNSRPQEETWVCSCGFDNKSKFCTNCGKPKSVAGEDGTWACPLCKTVGNRGRFCAQCGSLKPV